MKDGQLCRSKKRLQGRQPTKRQRKAVQLYGKGLSFFDAFTAAGYSPKQARKGTALFRQHPGLQIALAEEMESFPPEVRANLARLRLVNNALTGEDRAVQSCKLLGQDRELNLWEPEHQSGVVVYQVSPRLEAMAAALATTDDAVESRNEVEEIGYVVEGVDHGAESKQTPGGAHVRGGEYRDHSAQPRHGGGDIAQYAGRAWRVRD